MKHMKKYLLMAAAARMAASTAFAAGDETNGHAYFRITCITTWNQLY